MKTCLVNGAAAANTYYGLGNGAGGPVALSSAGTETVSSAAVSLDSAGRVLITKAAAFPDTVCLAGDSVLVSQGTGIQQGVYPISGKIGSDSIILGVHRSQCIAQRWRIDYTALPADGDTCTIGGIAYRFKTTTANPNDILRQADATATLTSLLLALGLTGAGQAGGSASPDYINTTVPNPLFKSGGSPSGSVNTGFIYIDTRFNNWPTNVAPTLTGGWGTVTNVGDIVRVPEQGQPAVAVGRSADCAVRLGTPGADKFSGVRRGCRITATQISGTTPSIKLYSPRYIQAPSGTSGPFFGAHDALVAAAAIALPTGIAVDLGEMNAHWGGILFAVSGANAVVILNYD